MSETGYKISRTVSVTDEDIKEVENYLKYHSFYAKLLKLDKYEQDYFGGGERVDIHSESTLAHARMFEIRHFIMTMQNSNEKLFLYYHYVRGDSVDRCAELIGISRSSAFRLKKRALALAAEKYVARRKREIG
jgi:DNA-directed RNA polymerase specialized sigma subunit